MIILKTKQGENIFIYKIDIEKLFTVAFFNLVFLIKIFFIEVLF